MYILMTHKSPHTSRLQQLFNSFGLHDCVEQPTHKMNHQPDVFVMHDTDQPLSVTIQPPMISDQALIITTVDTRVESVASETRPRVHRRCWVGHIQLQWVHTWAQPVSTGAKSSWWCWRTLHCYITAPSVVYSTSWLLLVTLSSMHDERRHGTTENATLLNWRHVDWKEYTDVTQTQHQSHSGRLSLTTSRFCSRRSSLTTGHSRSAAVAETRKRCVAC